MDRPDHPARSEGHGIATAREGDAPVRFRTVAGSIRLAAGALLLVVLATAAFALDVPPPPTRWYTDQAGLLSAADGDALNQKLADFEKRSGAQFIIYVLPTLGDGAMEDFTIKSAERWKVGNKKYDNGLILFVFVKEHKVRVEVGYGLEPTVTDSFSSDLINLYITPRFRNNDFAGGLNAAADAVIARIEKTEPPRPAAGPKPGGAAAPGGVDMVAVVILIFIFLFFILPMLRRRGAGSGGCGGCWLPMMLMGGGGQTFGGGGFGGGGGFSGGGGGFGGGGASGGW